MLLGENCKQNTNTYIYNKKRMLETEIDMIFNI